MMHFCSMTLGCKANQYDTGTIESIMRGRGHLQVKAGEGCDVCIVNTCAVTAESTRKSRQAIRRMKKLEPEALIAVCGCYPQLEREEIAALEADIIGGTKDREKFVKEIEEILLIKNEELRIKNERHPQFPIPDSTLHTPHSTLNSKNPITDSTFNFQLSTFNSRTRALLKIQDGCDNRCTYCIIPSVRGAARSIPPEEAASIAASLEEQGYKEIVITGIEISSYMPSLIDALRAVSAAAPDMRIRLGSLNPDVFTAKFMRELRKIPNLCNHFHISLQSGCDITLAAMERKYSTRQVYDAVERLRKMFDNCSITADLIVGFPGETDSHFEQTLTFIEKAAFSAMHIFPYSRRPGTKAADMPEQVSSGTKQQRARTATAIGAKFSERFKRAQIGKTLNVLFEKTKNVKPGQKSKYTVGHSGNYLNVAVPCRNARYGKITKNTIHNVKIKSLNDGLLFGEII